MAPKKKGKKGPKLTKAQKAKLKLEEEERRLREEEEARIQAEREEQERLERQRRQEILDKLEEKDSKRRGGELGELRSLLAKNYFAVKKHKNDVAQMTKWDKYMKCSDIPDSSVQQEVNTFISLWHDNQECSAKTVFKQCKVALQLIEETETLLREVTNEKHIAKYLEALLVLQDIVYTKILNISMEILKEAGNNIDTETGNMQAVIKDDNSTLCLWANLMRNPRFKRLTFKGVGLGFELTKQLAASNIALRVLHTSYDHLSLVCRLTHMKPTTAPRSLLTVFEDVPPEATVKQDDETPEETQDVEEAQQDEETAKEHEQDKIVEEEFISERLSEETMNSESQITRSSIPNSEDGDSQYISQAEVIADEKTPPPPHDVTEYREHVNVVDLRMYTPLGGVFYYELFHLPSQSFHIKGWEIQKISDTGLKVFKYVAEKPNPEDEEAASTLVSLSVKLPESVVFLETPQVARWDPEAKYWRMDGIIDFSYREHVEEEGVPKVEKDEDDDEEEEEEEEESSGGTKVSFKMEHFYPFVLMQRTYANFPFRRWELRPLGKDSALYSIQGALIDLSITIQGNQCMLKSDQELGLTDLFDKWMSAPDLQQAMLKAGINIFVNEHTEKFVTFSRKDPKIEHVAYEQMALFASVCTFSWSKWNAECGPEHFVVKLCEHQGLEQPPEDLWNLYLVGPQRFQKLEMKETSEVFCADHHPDSEFHSTFIHMIQDNMSPEGITRTREAHFLFVDTVQSLFCITRPLKFC
ncbi:dynein axonemal intermediate chain 7 isoform X1 [Corythoichthys intestinalis]|uniref:dynein axonemal intermediate chain 7 isoform X1 n=2 Tax=Corythoichthys intestinalis TaxID=161448 RepID=UPI0025A67CB2|nr:dynein axonemal intermediate chain 7 isoform X1 [Corythoichthys intestinalis]